MKKVFTLVLAAVTAAATLQWVPLDAEAARLGKGRPAGMQRQAPPAQPQQQQSPPPQQQQAPGTAQGGAPATAQPAAPATAQTMPAAGGSRNRWLAPIAGLAAGLGLAALASHLGFGEGLAQFMTLLLLALVGVVVVRWLMRRFARGPQQGGLRPASAGGGRAAGMDFGAVSQPTNGWRNGTSDAERGAPSATSAAATTTGAGAPNGAASTLPDNVDAAEFERVAKLMFIRLQAANDAGRIDDLRRYTTPELYAALRLDLEERNGAAQQTDVLKLDARVEDTTVRDDESVVSVRFTGLARERGADSLPEPFDESWHFVRPAGGSREWAIAGITPHG